MKKALKPLLSLILLIFILKLADTEEIKEGLSLISAFEIIILSMIYAIGQLISSKKWQLILQECEITTGYWQVAQSYFIGMFGNSFGFGVIGGDVLRSMLVAGPNQKSQAIKATFIDRIHGLVILSWIGIISLVLFYPNITDLRVTSLLPIIISILIFSYFWFFSNSLFNKFIKIFKPLRKLESIINFYRQRRKHLLVISCISIFFHLLQISLFYLLCSYLEININFIYLLIFIPFINILTALPISWNGLGVREVTLVFFLGDYLSKSEAISLGIIWLVIVSINALIGGLLSLRVPSQVKSST